MPQVRMKFSDALELIIRSIEMEKYDNALQLAKSMKEQLVEIEKQEEQKTDNK